MTQIVENLITMTGTTSHSEGENCVYCGSLIPPLEVEVLGKMRWVQPVCQCVSDKLHEDIKKAENLQREREVRELFSISDIGDRYKDASFETFQPRPGAESSFKIALHYAENFDDFGLESILFWGIPGNGKSHLAAAIHNELIRKHRVIVFISMPDLLEKIKSTFNKQSKESESQILKALNLCDLLIIDDIGAEKTSEWVQEIIFRIVDSRYRRKKPILATSNLEPKLLSDRIGARAYDRIIEMSQPIENKATSYRREIAKNRVSKFDSLFQDGDKQ